MHAQGLPLIRNYTAAEYDGHNRNFDIEIGEDGTIFVANFEGLLYYDQAQWRIVRAPGFNRVTSIWRDSTNTICVGGYQFKARLQKRANGELYMQRYSEESPAEEAALEGVIQTVKIDGGLQVQVIRNNGLVVTDEHHRERYTINEANGLCSNQVAHVVYDGHGVVWGATAHGVFAIELPTVYTYLLSKDGLKGEVQDITTYGGKIYVCYSDGVMTVASRQWRRIHGIDNICWDLCQSRDGLLAATSAGIYRIATDDAVSRLTSNSTTALFVEGDKVYAAESDGVYVWQPDFRERTKVSDLTLVTGIGKDEQGALWLRNIHGETEGRVPAPPSSDTSDPLLLPLSDIDATVQLRYDGKVWLGGDEILAIVDEQLAHTMTPQPLPRLRFRSIVLDNDSVLWGGYGEMPRQLPGLGSHERHLEFSYALDYAPLTGETVYRYRLNNDEWSDWSDEKRVEFPNHPFGSYTLSIQARLPNGRLSEVTSVDFSIAYPLLMRWYMVALYFIAFAFLVWLLFRYRLKRLEKDKIKLERIVDERTADLRNAQDELIRQEKMASVGKLTEGLIDRILNPMNYIINFSKMSNDLLKDLKENIDHNKDKLDETDYEDTLDVLDMLTENLENVDQYGQNTTRTLKAMEEMLKDRTGGFTDIDLLSVLQQNEQMFNTYYAKEKAQYGIQTVFTLPAPVAGDLLSPTMPIHGNPDLLSKTIMSLLGNAVYAVVKKAQRQLPLLSRRGQGWSDQPPVISLSATIASDRYILKIRDNGIGIEEKILDKIFDPFFTTKTTGEGAGIGLYLSREIIQNHGGDISVVSVKDEYTEFTISLPMRKQSV